MIVIILYLRILMIINGRFCLSAEGAHPRRRRRRSVRFWSCRQRCVPYIIISAAMSTRDRMRWHSTNTDILLLLGYYVITIMYYTMIPAELVVSASAARGYIPSRAAPHAGNVRSRIGRTRNEGTDKSVDRQEARVTITAFYSRVPSLLFYKRDIMRNGTAPGLRVCCCYTAGLEKTDTNMLNNFSWPRELQYMADVPVHVLVEFKYRSEIDKCTCINQKAYMTFSYSTKKNILNFLLYYISRQLND